MRMLLEDIIADFRERPLPSLTPREARLPVDLKSQGIACGKNSLHEYLDHLIDTYLIDLVPIHSRSLRQQQVNPRKAYVIDTGLALAFRHQANVDRGHLLENLVFNALRRQGQTITYFRTADGNEVDFHAVTLDGSVQLIQVCESLGDRETRARELRALSAALRECGLARGSIVTLEDQAKAHAIRVTGSPPQTLPANAARG